MKRNRKWVSIVFLCVLIAVIAVDVWANAQNYPQPVGYVNDFANLLSQEEGRKLNAELAAYDSTTTIEIAVVTVRSLSGMSAEDYSLGLANAWGVGKKEKNNGVVILIAPNERDGFIQIGRGLERTLREWEVQRIYDREMTPRFKAGKMSEGIIAGARSLMEKLTPQPVQAEKATAGSGRAFGKTDFLILVIIVGVIGALIFLGVLCSKVNQKKDNLSGIKECEKRLSALKDGYSSARGQLDALKAENPEAVWGDLDKKFLAISFRKLEVDLRQTRVDAQAGWKMTGPTAQSLWDLQWRLDNHLYLYRTIKDKVAEVEKAKKEAAALLEKLPGLIDEAEGKFTDPDMKTRLTQARSEYARARTQADGGGVDWLTLLVVLYAVHSLCEPESVAGRSDDRSAWHSHHDYSGGSDFGGFGGGSFGGAGGGGKW